MEIRQFLLITISQETDSMWLALWHNGGVRVDIRNNKMSHCHRLVKLLSYCGDDNFQSLEATL
jgi:hypothetical protein